jgi:hypothetical protein
MHLAQQRPQVEDHLVQITKRLFVMSLSADKEPTLSCLAEMEMTIKIKIKNQANYKPWFTSSPSPFYFDGYFYIISHQHYFF